MIKTILIATDFSLESLNIMKKVLRKKEAEQDDNQYKILLVSGYNTGESIRDLLFNNKAKIFGKIRPTEFVDAYTIIKNKYPNLVDKIVCDVFTGNFQRVFDNYLKTNEIEEAYFSDSLQESDKNSKFSLSSFLKKTKIIEAQQIKMYTPDFIPEKGKIAEVFVDA